VLAAAAAGCAPPVVPPPSGACATPAGEVAVVTRDALTLAADFRPGPRCGGPAALLLHMIPPAHDRSDWPVDLRDDLVAAGLAVLALDRRGAGGSEGDPEDAYLGPRGWLDAHAAARFLRDEGYGDLVVLGASNGTTTMIDYAARAQGEGLALPAALGFFSGGPYTEAQTPMARVPPIPALFAFPPQERDWSLAQRPLDPGSWAFHEYPGGGHGTAILDAAPRSRVDLLEFVTAAVSDGGEGR
jgi:pimeloyl-ACP methyl ester carboxylesterase